LNPDVPAVAQNVARGIGDRHIRVIEGHLDVSNTARNGSLDLTLFRNNFRHFFLSKMGMRLLSLFVLNASAETTADCRTRGRTPSRDDEAN
jgi:hypothetical protein